VKARPENPATEGAVGLRQLRHALKGMPRYNNNDGFVVVPAQSRFLAALEMTSFENDENGKLLPLILVLPASFA
jgi:hypothetical protein